MFRFLILFAFVAVRAEKPVLEALYPAGGAPGTTNVVAIAGKTEPWPPKVWLQGGGVEFIAQTNKGSFEARISADAAPGPRLVRLFNEEGSSDPQFFVVGSGPEISDAEPNDHFEKPQKVEALPGAINGRLDKNGDVDSFLISLKAGQWLDARLDSYRMMRSIDAVLRLVDGAGRQLAFNHDFGTLDPRLTWQAGSDQEVVLQVFGFSYPADSSVHLRGGPSAVYRLLIATSEAPPVDLHASCNEAEPNNSRAEAQNVPVPGSIDGLISESTDSDRFCFAVEKGQWFEFSVSAAAQGSPLDALLRIENAEGKELAANDDFEGTQDPKIEWSAPEDGTFFLEISSLTHRGGPSYRYTLRARHLHPGFEASAAAQAVELKAGETNTLALNVKMLRGYTNQLTIAVTNLPPGVSALPIEVPVKGGDLSVQLKAETNAPAASVPIGVQIRDGTNTTAVPFFLVSRSSNNGVPGGYSSLLLDSLDTIWLTVVPPPPPPAAEAAPETVAGK